MAETKTDKKGPNWEALGLKSPMEVIDILSLLNVDGEPIIKDDKALLDPRTKAKAVMEYFAAKFNVAPSALPYVASIIKRDLKQGKIGRRNVNGATAVTQQL